MTSLPFVSITVLCFIASTFGLTTGPTCYNCDSEVYPDTCKNLTQCGLHEKCHVEKYENTFGILMFRSGCKAAFECQSLGKRHLKSNRQASGTAVCSECCDGSHCNTAGCGYIGFNNNISLGPICYHCVGQIDGSRCATLTYCNLNEMCFREKSTGSNLYTSGCKPKNECLKLNTLDRCNGCCDGNFCNNNCTTIKASTILPKQPTMSTVRFNRTRTPTVSLTHATKALSTSGFDRTLTTNVSPTQDFHTIPTSGIDRTKTTKVSPTQAIHSISTLGVDMTFTTKVSPTQASHTTSTSGLHRPLTTTVPPSQTTHTISTSGLDRTLTTKVTPTQPTHTISTLVLHRTSTTSDSPTHSTHETSSLGTDKTLTTKFHQKQSTTKTVTSVGVGPKCFHCDAEAHPYTCSNVTQCGAHEKCHVEEYENTLGAYKFRSGCKSSFKCNTNKGHGQYRERRMVGTVMCSACCDGSYCNNVACSFSASTNSPVYTSKADHTLHTSTKIHQTGSHTKPTSAHSQETVKPQIGGNYPSSVPSIPVTMASKWVSASLTRPTMLLNTSSAQNVTNHTHTGSGPLCAKCHNIRDPHTCKDVIRCKSNEFCMAMFSTDTNQQRSHSLGCMPKDICGHFHREYHGDSRCEQCCTDGDACNSRGCPLMGDIGPVCYNCSNLRDPGECTSMHLCENDEECYTDVRIISNRRVYNTGCRKRSVCGTSGGLRIVGTNVIESCCLTPLCNDNGSNMEQLLQHLPITMPTMDAPNVETTTTNTQTSSVFLQITTTAANWISAKFRDIVKIKCKVPNGTYNMWWEKPKYGKTDNIVERYLGGDVYEIIILFAEHGNSGEYKCMTLDQWGNPYIVKSTQINVI